MTRVLSLFLFILSLALAGLALAELIIRPLATLFWRIVT